MIVLVRGLEMVGLCLSEQTWLRKASGGGVKASVLCEKKPFIFQIKQKMKAEEADGLSEMIFMIAGKA